MSLVGYQIHMQEINMNVQLDYTLPKINGSLQQLSQIVLNLVLHAKDALEGMSSDKREIMILTGQEGDFVYLSVSYSGDGVRKDHQSEVFHPFFTTKPAGQGTGLGLSVSLGIAQAHGGFIEMTSEPRLGSRFTLKLPKIELEGGEA